MDEETIQRYAEMMTNELCLLIENDEEIKESLNNAITSFKNAREKVFKIIKERTGQDRENNKNGNSSIYWAFSEIITAPYDLTIQKITTEKFYRYINQYYAETVTKKALEMLFKGKDPLVIKDILNNQERGETK